MIGLGQFGPWGGLGLVKEVHHGFVQGRMIAFQGEHVISLLVNDLAGYRGLAAHGGTRHDAAFQGEQPEEFRDGRDFIGMGLGFELAEHQLGFGHPGADHLRGYTIPLESEI